MDLVSRFCGFSIESIPRESSHLVYICRPTLLETRGQTSGGKYAQRLGLLSPAWTDAGCMFRFHFLAGPWMSRRSIARSLELSQALRESRVTLRLTLRRASRRITRITGPISLDEILQILEDVSGVACKCLYVN